MRVPTQPGTGLMPVKPDRYRLSAWVKTDLCEGAAYVRVDGEGAAWFDDVMLEDLDSE